MPMSSPVPEHAIDLNLALWQACPCRHLTLAGVSGAGKTTVGPLVAQRLGMASVDLDAEIERQAKMPISRIFALRGEAGFRTQELAVLRRVLRRKTPTVVALGGGTWHQAAARALLTPLAQEVLLDVSHEAACARLRQDELALSARPKLAGSEPWAALAQVMQERAASHSLCRMRVPTSGRTPDEVARGVVAAWQTHTHDVLQARHFDTTYRVVFSAQGPERLTGLLGAHVKAKRVALIVDAQVHGLFGGLYETALRAAGHTPVVLPVPPGDTHKTLAQAQELLGRLAAAGLGRHDVVVGLGGGMALDLAAFVAGIYLRGVTFCGVATTMLAAVDASVGGKCGVNLGSTKNLVGLIRAPAGVIVDMAAVLQQPGTARAEGAIEALKMGALFAPELMGRVAALDYSAEAHVEPWQQVMAHAVALKIAVCRQDPNEAHLRKALNYGHTIGHAIESGSQFVMGHGKAVALGMVAEAEFAERMGLARNVATPLKHALRAMNMATDWRRATVNVEALLKDKKGDGHTVVLPVVPTLGRVALHTLSMAQLIDFVRSS